MPTTIPTDPTFVQVWIDFDGTITRKDVLDELIANFAMDDSWRMVEVAWQAGQIGSFDCLRAEFDVVRVAAERLEAFLTEVPIDPGAATLFGALRAWDVPTAILSDGIESFIAHVLARAGIVPVPVRANRIDHVGDRLNFGCPHRSETCRSAAAHCKCASIASMGTPGRRSIYIGDGRSDLCPARDADIVFAKNALAKTLASEGRPFIAFDTLHDVHAILSDAWSKRATAI